MEEGNKAEISDGDKAANAQTDAGAAKRALLEWSQRVTDRFPELRLKDFARSWADGRAFLCILHRYRPDLVDLSAMKRRDARANLDLAFSLAERELGVTRLLDPEDLVAAEPDERSVMTYVSQLREAFPGPPPAPGPDQDALLAEYRPLASDLVTWLRGASAELAERGFPNSLSEMSALSTALLRHKKEEYLQRTEQFARLEQLHEELQETVRRGGAEFYLAPEQDMEHARRLWDKYCAALAEKEVAVQAELSRLERLQRLAEKVIADCKQGTTRVGELEEKIKEGESAVNAVHPHDTRRICERLEQHLVEEEHFISRLFAEAQVLRDGRFHLSDQLYDSVSQLHQRWLELRRRFQTQVVERSSGVATPSRRQTSRPDSGVDGERHPQLMALLEWLAARRRQLEEASEFGSDVPGARRALDDQAELNAAILDFRSQVDAARQSRVSVGTADLDSFDALMEGIEASYAELLHLSAQRSKWCESLMEFLQAATEQLLWLSEKENVELSRDWTTKDLNVEVLSDYARELMNEREVHQVRFDRVIAVGNALIHDGHPAVRTLEAYRNALEEQWAWLGRLLACLDRHLRHTKERQQFFGECRLAANWQEQQATRLRTDLNAAASAAAAGLSVDDGERLIRELRALKERFDEHESALQRLLTSSRTVCPSPQLALSSGGQPLKVRALCAFQGAAAAAEKDEDLRLLSQPDDLHWIVSKRSGEELEMPGVCLHLPPPCEDASEQAQDLCRGLQELRAFHLSLEFEARRELLRATVRVMRSWSAAEFHRLEPQQRLKIIEALNSDGNSLLSDMAASGVPPAEVTELETELAAANRWFNEQSASTASVAASAPAAGPEGRRESVGGEFSALVEQLQQLANFVTVTEAALCRAASVQVPKDGGPLGQSVAQHKELEQEIAARETELEYVTQQCQGHEQASALSQPLELLLRRWHGMCEQSQRNFERLRSTETFLTRLDELDLVLSDAELLLASHRCLPPSHEDMKRTLEQLKGIGRAQDDEEAELAQLPGDWERLNAAVRATRIEGEPCRDVAALEQSQRSLAVRWNNVRRQVSERLTYLTECIDNYGGYRAHQKSVQKWQVSVQTRARSQTSLGARADVHEKRTLVEKAVTLIEELAANKPEMDKLNQLGAKVIAAGKRYDHIAETFRDEVESVHTGSMESLDKGTKKARFQSGVETVSGELDRMNKDFEELVASLREKMNAVTPSVAAAGYNVPTLPKKPILRVESYQKYVERALSNRHSRVFDAVVLPTEMEEALAPVTVAPAEATPAEHRRFETVTKAQTQAITTPLTPDSEWERDLSWLVTRLRSATGKQLALGEAVRLGLIDLKKRRVREQPKAKPVPVTEAVEAGLLKRPAGECLFAPVGALKSTKETTVADLIAAGEIDLGRGTVRDPVSKQAMTADDALTLGVLPKSTWERVKALLSDPMISSGSFTIQGHFGAAAGPDSSQPAMTLAECLTLELFNAQSGLILDPVHEVQVTLQEAIQRGLVTDLVREIRDPASGERLSLADAISRGIVVPQKGYYNAGKKSVPLPTAFKEGKVSPPPSLHGLLLRGDLDLNTGEVFTEEGKVSFEDAVDRGFVETERKCLLDNATGESLCLREAIAKGLLDWQCRYPSPRGGTLSLQEAVNAGHVSVTQQQPLACSRGARRQPGGPALTLIEALKAGVVEPLSGEVVDKAHNRRLGPAEAAREGLLTPALAAQLASASGLEDPSSGEPLAVKEAIRRGFVDCSLGRVSDPRSNRVYTLQEAASCGLLAPEKAQALMQLMSPLMTATRTVCRVRRCDEPPHEPKAGVQRRQRADQLPGETGELAARIR